MVKENTQTKKKEASANSWMDDIEIEKVEKVADLEILPKLEFEVGVIKKVQLLTEPKLTPFADGNSYYTQEALFEGVKHQINCNAKSYRFQLAVLIKKYGIERVMSENIAITKVLADIKVDGKLYRNSEVYKLSILE